MVTSAEQRVRDVVAPAVAAAGLVLEDVTVAPAGRRSVVRVTVDAADDAPGVDSDSLADVSRAVSAALDAADPVRGAYVLEVSTPGTSRPLTELRHFRRARGRLVHLQLADGSRRFGRLVAAEADALVLVDGGTPDGAEVTVPTTDVVRGTVEVELSRTEEED
jgi:ribosome maturation factor RimP